MQNRLRSAVARAVLCAFLSSLAASVGAQTADEADQSYQVFKRLYGEAQTVAELRAALDLVERAHSLDPKSYRYAFGVGATYQRLTEFALCEQWFGKAFDLANNEDRRQRAKVQRDYCQNELDMGEILGAPTLRMSFVTKHDFVTKPRPVRDDIMSDLNIEALPIVFADALELKDAELVTAVQQKLPQMRVALYEHYVIAAEWWAEEHGARIAEYERQIRRRFFPSLAKERLIVVLSREPVELRRLARRLYPGAVLPRAPSFGIYHRRDRLILATVLGGYGTLLHELVHALVEDDYPDAPLWLEEGMATLYERSGWRSERLVPVPNWRMVLITPDEVLDENAFAEIDNTGEVGRKQLALIRLLFSFLDDNDRLATLYAAVKRLGPEATLVQALEAIELDRNAWREFVQRSFRQYALEMRNTRVHGLTNPGEIKFVQRALNVVMEAGLKPDGLTGPTTERALRDFQSRFSLKVDGVLGPKTLAALRREYGKRLLE